MNDDLQYVTDAITEAMYERNLEINYENSRRFVRAFRMHHDLSPKKRKKKPIEYFSDSEWDLFLETAYAWPKHGRQYGLMVKMLKETAMRVGAFSKLQLEDINLTDRRILIREAKGGKSRYVPIMKPLADELAQYFGGRTEGDLFLSQRGSGYSSRRIQMIVTQIGDKCDLHATPHKLRRTHATFLLNAGMSIEAISKFLGHSSVAVTQQFYAEMQLGRVMDEMEAVYRNLSGQHGIDPAPDRTPIARRSRRKAVARQASPFDRN